MKPMSAYKSLNGKPCKKITIDDVMNLREHPETHSALGINHFTPSLCDNVPISSLLDNNKHHFTGIITLRYEGPLKDLCKLETCFRNCSFLDRKKNCLFVFYNATANGDKIEDNVNWYHHQYWEAYLQMKILRRLFRPSFNHTTLRQCENSYLEYVDL